MANQIVELQSDLFQELSDADSTSVVGGTGTVSSTVQGLTGGGGQTVGLVLQGGLGALTAANESLNGFLGNSTKPITDQIPV